MGKNRNFFASYKSAICKMIVCGLVLLGLLIAGCQFEQRVVETPFGGDDVQIPQGMTEEEAATLLSLEQIDDYPLYTMIYQVDYSDGHTGAALVDSIAEGPAWACSLFVVLGNSEELLFGRNFDWDFSPGLLLFTDPPDGYKSVSMVDLYYLGYGGDQAFGITDLPLSERADLLDAPLIPFDGMNETGLVVGMAAVPDGGRMYDREKETIDSVLVIRKILDQAATIEEAVAIINNYNIDMGTGPSLHYLIADRSGRSALVEFTHGEVVVIYNQEPWQQATNFLFSESPTPPESQCWRYGLIGNRLRANEGELNFSQAMRLLEDVAQESTQWSVVYGFSAGKIEVVMGGKYHRVHKMDFEMK